MRPVSVAVLRTLCFADAIGMALSALEIKRLSGLGFGPAATLEEIVSVLREDSELVGLVTTKDGFYVLKGSERSLAARQESLAVAEEKWLMARRAVSRLRHLPWIRLVAVCNTVAMGGPRRGSDVDIFLVIRPGRIWAARLLVHAALAVGSLARRGQRVEDKLCLSFSVTDEATDLSKIAKDPSDPYLAVWLATLVPVIDRDGAYGKLLAANGWLRGQLSGFGARRPASPRVVTDSPIARIASMTTSGPIGGLVDRFARVVQRPRIMHNPASRVHDGGNDVVVTDSMLKFHEADTRTAIREAFLERTARYGV